MTSSETLVSTLQSVKSQLAHHQIRPHDIETLTRLLAHEPLSSHDISSLIAVIDPFVKLESYWSLDPDLTVIELYQTVLSKLELDDILAVYPMDFILDNVARNNPFSLLIVKVLNFHSEKVGEYPDLLYEIVRCYLGDKYMMVGIASQAQQLICLVPEPAVYNESRFQTLFNTTKRAGDSILVPRLLELVLGLVPAVTFDLDFPLDLDDELFCLLVINFYDRLVEIGDPEIMSAIKAKITDIFTLFRDRTTNDTVSTFLVTDIINFIQTVSYKAQNSLPKAIFDPVTLHLDLASDVQFLSKVNPEVFPMELVEYVVEFPLFSQRYFPIVLNLARLGPGLAQLLRRDKVSSLALLSISIDFLYRFLLALCGTSRGVSYLLGLPLVLNERVLDLVPANKDIFALKLDLLEKLFHYDLLLWEEPLRKVYREMKYGRELGRVEPRVEVADEVD